MRLRYSCPTTDMCDMLCVQLTIGGTMKTLDVVTFGESMVLFSPDQKGPLKHIHNFSKSIAGAESNVSIALARLGSRVGWFGRLGNDEFGRYIQFMLMGDGVDTSRTIYDDTYQTGLLFKEVFEHADSNVYYYRKDSAASHMTPEDLDENYIKRSRTLHITGITPAISPSARAAVKKAVMIAKENDVMVSLDPNIRRKLWSIEAAKATLLDLCQWVDILFPGIEEGQMLTGETSPESIIQAFHDLGVKIVVLKLGKKGCMISDGTETLMVPGYVVEKMEDSIGAGDGFAAGFLHSYLSGETLKSCGENANGVGAMATLVKGDSEGFPTYDQLMSFTGKIAHIDR